MEKFYITWNDIEIAIEELAYFINKSGLYIKSIKGIERGGLIPAVLLSHKLDIPMTHTLCLNDKSTLIIDDICDSGNTLAKYISLGFPTATIHLKQTSTIKPTFWVKTVGENEWVIYPWEREDSETIADYLKQKLC